ncbi:MAG: hypothetical protein M3392_00940 [Actinomycetota bacterium]|nr:hypothetical protein [Actinomycetota bacterium]
MMKTAIEKVTWVGRVTVFAVGLAVVLALTVIETTNLEPIPCGSKHVEAILWVQERLVQMFGVPVFEDDLSVGVAHALVESRRRRG